LETELDELNQGNLKKDVKFHEKIHKRWEEASKIHGDILSYREREDLKGDGWELVLYGSSLEVKLTGLIKVLRSHFYRSLELAVWKGYWKKHPQFEKYVAMRDMSHCVSDKKIITELQKRYGRTKGKIAPYFSYWFPANSDDRMEQFESYEREKLLKKNVRQFKKSEH